MIRKVGPGEEVGREGQVTGTGRKGVIAGQEGVAGWDSEVAGTGANTDWLHKNTTVRGRAGN